MLKQPTNHHQTLAKPTVFLVKKINGLCTVLMATLAYATPKWSGNGAQQELFQPRTREAGVERSKKSKIHIAPMASCSVKSEGRLAGGVSVAAWSQILNHSSEWYGSKHLKNQFPSISWIIFMQYSFIFHIISLLSINLTSVKRVTRKRLLGTSLKAPLSHLVTTAQRWAGDSAWAFSQNTPKSLPKKQPLVTLSFHQSFPQCGNSWRSLFREDYPTESINYIFLLAVRRFPVLRLSSTHALGFGPFHPETTRHACCHCKVLKSFTKL